MDLLLEVQPFMLGRGCLAVGATSIIDDILHDNLILWNTLYNSTGTHTTPQTQRAFPNTITANTTYINKNFPTPTLKEHEIPFTFTRSNYNYIHARIDGVAIGMWIFQTWLVIGVLMLFRYSRIVLDIYPSSLPICRTTNRPYLQLSILFHSRYLCQLVGEQRTQEVLLEHN